MRVGIVNDLATAREALRRLVLSVDGYAVAWLAEDGARAVELAARDRPDAILMDLVMPGMGGAEATRLIMQNSPCPILLVTSSVSGNLGLVYQAMGHGGLDAVDYADGPKLLAKLDHLDRGRRPPKPAALAPIVAIGASTGGPEAVARVLEALPADLPAAVVVVQHMAAEFIPNFALWLRGRSRMPVDLARPGTRPWPGAVVVAATDDHLVLRPSGEFAHTAEPAGCPHHPSIDAFFQSAARCAGRPGVGVLLTGMLDDGALGLLAMRQAGWFTVAQDEATSVVASMPRAAAELRAAMRVLPLPLIGPAVAAHFRPAP